MSGGGRGGGFGEKPSMFDLAGPIALSDRDTPRREGGALESMLAPTRLAALLLFDFALSWLQATSSSECIPWSLVLLTRTDIQGTKDSKMHRTHGRVLCY